MAVGVTAAPFIENVWHLVLSVSRAVVLVKAAGCGRLTSSIARLNSGILGSKPLPVERNGRWIALLLVFAVVGACLCAFSSEPQVLFVCLGLLVYDFEIECYCGVGFGWMADVVNDYPLYISCR
jgi:hypothetical protein